MPIFYPKSLMRLKKKKKQTTLTTKTPGHCKMQLELRTTTGNQWQLTLLSKTMADCHWLAYMFGVHSYSDCPMKYLMRALG